MYETLPSPKGVFRLQPGSFQSRGQEEMSPKARLRMDTYV